MTLIIEHDAVQAYIDLAAKGGFTVQGGHGPEGQYLATYNGSGFAVSLPNYETRIKQDAAKNKAFWLGVMNGLEDIRRRLEHPQHHYIGGWWNREDGYVYLDISVIVRDREEALALARECGQLAIFSFDTFEEIGVTG